MKKKIVIISGFIIIFVSTVLIYNLGGFRNQELVKMNFIKENLSETPLPSLFSQNVKDILLENSLDGITQVLYTAITDNDNQVYSYIRIDNSYYDLGQVSYTATYLEDYFLHPTDIAGESTIYKWSELHGANYTLSKYITIKNGIPYLIRSIDGHTFEQDIDNNGNIETVASHGTAVETIIYEWDIANKSISFANLNHGLNSPSVVFLDEKNLFEAAIQNSKGKYKSVLYKYDEGMLYSIK
ncbi:hypothetical protein [Alkaliphilus peptidifermentans]|uniref:Uncharacterized protein n=1 Tax=Alkaliphilus peptidifermentans DSM 18978 TaxID=1120976 RepID=A0A1G5JMG6_9FIRM|nr:hypothetical protein [Alkaliphilus peptidifermentans]SCY89506.1 hypothetical protein SAMN03080606_02933 [Alkaliphilus peptidifermentans DSM 18978]